MDTAEMAAEHVSYTCDCVLSCSSSPSGSRGGRPATGPGAGESSQSNKRQSKGANTTLLRSRSAETTAQQLGPRPESKTLEQRIRKQEGLLLDVRPQVYVSPYEAQPTLLPPTQ